MQLCYNVHHHTYSLEEHTVWEVKCPSMRRNFKQLIINAIKVKCSESF